MSPPVEGKNMGKVRLLSSDLANQIAAGEVVERPASVAKELIENAIDAGATRVRVDIDHGGVTRISVSDDGEGMIEADARLALERHATSKIAKFEDLLSIATFGFRGEALPSIGSVARLTLTTRTRDADEGRELIVEGGGSPRVRPVGCAVGTTVEVRDLFFNVPARRKFLKATATESAHVGEVVLLAALARHDVTFTLARDGKVAREYLRARSRGERVAQALGDEKLAACMGERGPMRIEAYLAPPERARSGASALHLFVNGRPVRDRQLARAVAQSYGSVLEPGRYPVGVVYIELPPEHVDVNVHPQKAEVRFADGRAAFDAVTRELHLVLAKAFAIPSLGPPSRPWLPPRPPMGAVIAAGGGELRHATPSSIPPAEGSWPPSSGYPLAAPAVGSSLAEPSLFAQPGFYGRLRFLAQLRTTFLLCEGDDGLYVLDQHAAAERVTFDRLRRSFSARDVAMQRLLLPEVIELAASEVSALEDHAAEIGTFGVELRAVGASAVAVHAVPKLLARVHPEVLVRDLVAELGRAAGRPFGGAADLVIATMACHGSTRAGDKLSADEAMALLTALDRVDFSGHCPHGRPVVTRLGYDELEHRVGRH